MKTKLFRRCLAVLLALAMVFSLVPTAAFAGDEGDGIKANGVEADGITVNVIAAEYREGDWEILYPGEGNINTAVTVTASNGDPTLIDAVYAVDGSALVSDQSIDKFLGRTPKSGVENNQETDPKDPEPGVEPSEQEADQESTGWRCSISGVEVKDYSHKLESNNRIVFFYAQESAEAPGWDSLVGLLTPEPGNGSDPGTTDPDPGESEKDTITVYFTLRGLDHSLNEETWIEFEEVTVTRGASAADVIIKAISDRNGFSQSGAEEGFVTSVTRNGFTLSLAHEGLPNSSWMFKVNSCFAEVGVRDYKVADGDHVLLYFTKDYMLDFDPEMATGDEGKGEDGKPTADITITPVVRDNVAVAAVDSGLIKEALDKLKDTETKETREVKVEVAATAGMAASRVELKAGDIKAIAKAENVQLTVTSAKAALTFDAPALAGLAKGVADHATIGLTIAAVDTAQMDAERRAIIDRAPAVFDLSVTVGDTVVHQFEGTATVFLPYVPATGTDPAGLTVHHLGADLRVTPLPARYDAERGGFVFATTHFSLFFIAEQAAGAPAEEWVNPFTDVHEQDWFFDVVKYININQLMGGTTADKFSPQAPMTRAMLVTVLHRHAGEPGAGATPAFTDVGPGAWYGNAVAWAAENGMVAGYDNGRFGAQDNVTREQLAAILRNHAARQGRDVSQTADLSGYADAAAVSPWAREAMAWARAADLVRGRSAVSLAPKGTATRAEVGAILMRYVEGDAA